jgi:S-DNA-T family DNA segregation ATPase FtsK/SpoIIIE
LSTLDLVGRVATRRLLEERENARGRAFFCMFGLDAPVVTAIARHLAEAGRALGDVEVLVHPELVDGDLGGAVSSDKKAPYYRNRPTPGMRLTVCTAPVVHMKEVEPTLAHKSKIDDAWLLQNEVAWVEEGLGQCAPEIQQSVAKALRGMLDASVAHDALTTAAFVDRVARHLVKDGMPPEKAIRAALPALRLPRDGGDPRLHVTESREVAARFFNRLVDEIQPSLYLKARDGDPLNRSELGQRLSAMSADATLAPSAAATLGNLLDDRTVHDGDWTTSQAEVAELGWEAIELFFSDAKRKPKLSFGAETKAFFDNQFPNILNDSDAKLLDDLAKDSLKPSEDVDAFFADHRGRLQTEPKLYKRWEKLVFRPPIETADLGEGLLLLAHRAMPDSDDEAGVERVLVVRLRKSEQMDFWTRQKNTVILRYLRDRYRGLREMLQPHAVLDFGRCWDDDWEQELTEENISRGKAEVELEFEAFMVDPDKLETVLAEPSVRPHANRAQMTWKPAPNAIGLSLPIDLRHLRPAGSESARLMTGKVRHNRASRSASATNINLAERTSIIDAFGESRGELANVGRATERVDLTWPVSLQTIRDQGILTAEQADEIGAAFAAFQSAYSDALEDLLRGEGLGSQSLITQAERYGALLDTIMGNAPQEVSIRDLLAPATSIGLIEVDGDSVSAIVAAWHPLRLAEIAAKARQLAYSIGRVITGSAEQRSGIEDFINDRIGVFAATYYADIAVTNALEPVLLAETQLVADYSLLEPVGGEEHGITDEPADAAVKAFERVGDEYLKLRPHERSNFSIVILNADSENLPLAMANGLSRRIEDDPDIRCELVVTDDDPVRLREVYERQNRRISHEIDTSLASEAARNFLSRLRVGILSPETLTSESGLKSNDIVLLQDVIARSSKERWSKGDVARGTEPIGSFIPTARSKRRPFRKGNTTSALYLTAPVQPVACQSYVDALRALTMRDVTRTAEPWLPIQEVEFRSGDVAELLSKAHSLGTWVMTFDRVADRRLITTDARRIVRYFSVPGSTHNVIVSTEISEEDLGDRISSDLAIILPAADVSEIVAVRHQLFTRAVSLSGGVVMRGAQWSNYAHELLGLVLSQREIERMLTRDRECQTGWFFLDDFRDWLDLSGEMADILAINFSSGASGPEIRIVIAEAKYVGQDKLLDHRRRSASQLDSTWTTIDHRLRGGDANLDPSIWRNRLADMVLEHMDPFDQVGGLTQDEWLEGLRAGCFPITVDGHSLVFSHELEAVHETMPFLPDEERVQSKRRRLSQWIFFPLRHRARVAQPRARRRRAFDPYAFGLARHRGAKQAVRRDLAIFR